MAVEYKQNFLQETDIQNTINNGKDMKWEALTKGAHKVKMDETMFEKLNKVGIGAVTRDEDDRVIQPVGRKFGWPTT